jgi:hypothetical protein
VKKIWNENIHIATHVERTAYNGRVNVQVLDVRLTAIAYYDTSLDHAVLDLAVTPKCRYEDEPLPWYYDDTRSTAEDLGSREAATRWAIARIDRIAAVLCGLVPPPDERSDEEILAAAHNEN